MSIQYLKYYPNFREIPHDQFRVSFWGSSNFGVLSNMSEVLLAVHVYLLNFSLASTWVGLEQTLNTLLILIIIYFTSSRSNFQECKNTCKYEHDLPKSQNHFHWLHYQCYTTVSIDFGFYSNFYSHQSWSVQILWHSEEP